MLKEKKEDSNYRIQHPTAPAIDALQLSGLWHHRPAVVRLSFLYLASSHTRIWLIRGKMLKFRADRRVRYVRCDDGREGRRKFTASGGERICSEKIRSWRSGRTAMQCYHHGPVLRENVSLRCRSRVLLLARTSAPLLWFECQSWWRDVVGPENPTCSDAVKCSVLWLFRNHLYVC